MSYFTPTDNLSGMDPSYLGNVRGAMMGGQDGTDPYFHGEDSTRVPFNSTSLTAQGTDTTNIGSSLYPNSIPPYIDTVSNVQQKQFGSAATATPNLHNGLVDNYEMGKFLPELSPLRPFRSQTLYYSNSSNQEHRDKLGLSDHLDSFGYNRQSLGQDVGGPLTGRSWEWHHSNDFGVVAGRGRRLPYTGARESLFSAPNHPRSHLFLDDNYLFLKNRRHHDFNPLSSDYPTYQHQHHNLHEPLLHTQYTTQNDTHLLRPLSAPLLAQNHYNRSSQVGQRMGAPANPASSSYMSDFSASKFSNVFNLNSHSLIPGSGQGNRNGPGESSTSGPSLPGVGGLFGNGPGKQAGEGNTNTSGAGPHTTQDISQQSLSSESQAYYGNETMVKELRPEFIRWFFRYEQDRKWTPFTGYDSIRLESKYREEFGDRMLYSYSAYYPAASSNDESTDFSKFAQHQQVGDGFARYNNNMGMDMIAGEMSFQARNPYGPETGIQQRWWPGTAMDTEFNNGGPGFPSRVRNNSLGTTLFGRNDGVTAREKMLHKANSASALLGGPGSLNGMTSGNPDITKVVVVREGLYEVDLNTWTCFSTYWPGDTCIITRGTWFFDGTWDPLPVEQAAKLEEAHMSKFYGATLMNMHHHNQSMQGGQQVPEDRGAPANNAPAIHRISFNDFHVDWTTPSDVFWYSAAPSHKLMRSVGQKLGFSDWGQRICRGYYKPALIVDKPSEISHIVFVIHGIGQKMDTGRIVRNCSAFRDCVTSMKDKYFPQLNNAKQRAEFFPVEWRSAAKLDGDVVEAITPQKLLSLRQLLNSTAMDIMYYTSPLYRAEIQNALIDELNRIYANFVKRNPNFILNGGKVSVMAHSLGAVITYDIITGYLSGSVVDDMSYRMSQLHQMPRHLLPQQQGLLFTLEHFFCLGSPLAVFLALRWREPHDPILRAEILPQHLCRRIYNVFYSSDPVAYRLEPLLNRQYSNIAPVTIHAYNAPTKPRYSEMPRELIKTANETGTTANGNSSIPVPPFGETGSIPGAATMSSLKPPLPSLPSLPKPNLPSVMKLPLSPSKPGAAAPEQQTNNQNTFGNWFGGNLMKLWKGSTSPATGLFDSGLSQFTGAHQQQSTTNNPNDAMGSRGDNLAVPPSSSLGVGNFTNPLDADAAFMGQQSKENYTTVTEEDLLNIPNDLDYRLDFVLRESQFSGSGYIAALTSHTSYWNSLDAAYFVMTHLYDDLIEQSASY